jgi:hypothetical protein
MANPISIAGTAMTRNWHMIGRFPDLSTADRNLLKSLLHNDSHAFYETDSGQRFREEIRPSPTNTGTFRR